jgi:hypothetical protein
VKFCEKRYVLRVVLRVVGFEEMLREILVVGFGNWNG